MLSDMDGKLTLACSVPKHSDGILEREVVCFVNGLLALNKLNEGLGWPNCCV